MALLNNLYSVVKNIILREGQAATLIQEQKGGQGTYDPSTSKFSVATPSSTTVKVILLDYTLTSNGAQAKTDSLIQAGDKQCYLDGKTSAGIDLTVPICAVGDKLVVGSTTWRIVNVKEYNPSGSFTIMYDLQLRK